MFSYIPACSLVYALNVIVSFFSSFAESYPVSFLLFALDDAESCCEKLEHVLAYRFTDDQSPREGKLQEKIRLNPLQLNCVWLLCPALFFFSLLFESVCFAAESYFVCFGYYLPALF